MKPQIWLTAYFDCVIAEAISTLGRRLHEKRRAGDFGILVDRLLSDFPADNLLWITPETRRVYQVVIELVRDSGGELNFNDALIAILYRDLGIPALASFDPDFDKVSWLQRISRPEDVGALIPPASG